MKAVLASAQFQSLDDDGDGLLQVDDLVRAFAGVGGVSFEQALAMANLVMRAATEDRRVAADKAAAKGKKGSETTRRKAKGKQTAPVEVEEKPDAATAAAMAGAGAATEQLSINFDEFMVAREGGNFESVYKALELVAKAQASEGTHRDGKAADPQRQYCQQAFAHAQAEMRKFAERRRAETAERDRAAALGTAEDTAAGAPAASSAASSHSQPTPATPTLPPATALAPNATRAEERARRDLLLHYLATGQYDEAEALGWRTSPNGDDMHAPLTADDERRAAWIRHYLSSGELPEAIKLGWSSQLVVSSLAAGQMREARKLGWLPAGEEPKAITLPDFVKGTAAALDPKDVERRTAWIKHYIAQNRLDDARKLGWKEYHKEAGGGWKEASLLAAAQHTVAAQAVATAAPAVVTAAPAAPVPAPAPAQNVATLAAMKEELSAPPPGLAGPPPG